MAHIFTTIIVAVLAIFTVAALVGPIANLATQSTASHVSFNPNANVTASSVPGLMPIIQLYPIFFVLIGAIFFLRMLNPGSRWEGETEEHPYPPSQPRLEPETQPEPVTENCKNCGGPNVDRVTCQYCGQVLD